MIFSIQRFVEDHLERRGFDDTDQYGLRVARAFDQRGSGASEGTLAGAFARIRTVFFRKHRKLDRSEFELRLARLLKRKFKKKLESPYLITFRNGLGPARNRIRHRRRSIGALLYEFQRAVEGKAVDAFWKSRRQGRLRPSPEKIGQALLAVFAKGVIGDSGLVLREMSSGIGFVDVGLSFGGVLHLVELKIMKSAATGANQLSQYMRTERRREGWLLLLDVRRTQDVVPQTFTSAAGVVRTVLVNLNPQAPHAT